ncbi:hypothetical protein CEXT_52091 [Caerostris extrusa]|uniref:Uncharacterized protein n=1 Tax=Caerostris extrusa TaxID=172846 RepID=A0AAV4N6W0_CAEEX|nr:hypothetical protein CEXT_52091 [Caerostris extrusa]
MSSLCESVLSTAGDHLPVLAHRSVRPGGGLQPGGAFTFEAPGGRLRADEEAGHVEEREGPRHRPLGPHHRQQRALREELDRPGHGDAAGVRGERRAGGAEGRVRRERREPPAVDVLRSPALFHHCHHHHRISPNKSPTCFSTAKCVTKMTKSAAIMASNLDHTFLTL